MTATTETKSLVLDGLTFETPFAHLLPPLSDEQFAELEESIRQFGMKMPILFDSSEKKIIDGINRARVAERLGLTIEAGTLPVKVLPDMDDDALAQLALDLNLARRQTTPENRLAAYQRLKGLGFSLRKIAEIAGVSARTIGREVEKSKIDESATAASAAVADSSKVEEEGESWEVFIGDEEPGDGLPVEQRATEPTPAPKVVDKLEGKDGVKRPAEQLTKSQLADRKREVRDLRKQGLTVAEIAERTGFSERTIEADIASQKAAPKPKKPAAAVLDAHGVAVPHELRDYFGDPSLAKAIEAVRELRATFEEVLNPIYRDLKNKWDALVYLRCADGRECVKTVGDELQRLEETLIAGKPHALCPSCHGAIGGCPDCRKSGYVPAWREAELEAQG